jgi:carbon-monoxide dehydrogenase large subunit
MHPTPQRVSAAAVPCRASKDRALLEGRGRFTDNVAVPGETVIAFLRSPYAHARIAGIDVDGRARHAGRDRRLHRRRPGSGRRQGIADDAGLQARRRAQHCQPAAPRPGARGRALRRRGDRAVVAESREQARDALDAIVLDLEELPSVTDARAARQAGAAVVTAEAPDNIAAEMRHGDAAATEAAFARAAHRVALDVHNQRLAPSPMEPRSVVARFDERAAGSRCASATRCRRRGRRHRGTLPDLAPPQVHVLVGDVGGGFGMKTGRIRKTWSSPTRRGR